MSSKLFTLTFSCIDSETMARIITNSGGTVYAIPTHEITIDPPRPPYQEPPPHRTVKTAGALVDIVFHTSGPGIDYDAIKLKVEEMLRGWEQGTV